MKKKTKSKSTKIKSKAQKLPKLKAIKTVTPKTNVPKAKVTKVEVPKWNKIHYVCTGGCGLVTNDPGRCTSLGCYRNRNPLNECQCKNGKHGNLPTLNVLKGAPLPPGSKLVK